MADLRPLSRIEGRREGRFVVSARATFLAFARRVER